jgi:regulator of protease activity HflC (stomatin/prohibitin superfamily)
MDVQVMFHIPMDKAPAVVADLGSMKEMISQVLEPAVSSHFRNAAQTVNALDLYTKRAELANAAKKEISSVLERYHIESRDVMITDVVLPEAIIAPVKAAAVADQEKLQYQAEQKAQEARKELEFSKKQADMQEALVESQRGIEISDNNAQAAVKKAEGEKKAGILAAEGRAKTVEIEADAQAHKVKTEGEAEAGITKLKGEAEGVAIRAKGEAQAAAYKLSQEALGPDYARLQIIEAIAKNNLKIIPENILIGGSSNGSLINQFLGIEMIEKLTGKPFNPSVTQIQSPSETPTEETTVEE